MTVPVLDRLVDVAPYVSHSELDQVAAELDAYLRSLAAAVHQTDAAARRVFPAHASRLRKTMPVRAAVDEYRQLAPGARRVVDLAVRLADHRDAVTEALAELRAGRLSTSAARRVLADLPQQACPAFRATASRGCPSLTADGRIAAESQ